MYKCGVCGKGFSSLDDYLVHTTECVSNKKKEINQKYLEEVNAAINKVKAAKDYYEQTLDEFQKKYPKEYEINFASKTKEGNNLAHKTKSDSSVKTEQQEHDLFADFPFYQLLK